MSTYNDGMLPYGSRVVALTGSLSTTMIADDFSIDRPSTMIKRKDQLGNPTGQVIIGDFVAGTATLQMVSSSILPTIGDTFTTVVSGSTGETFIISKVGQPESSTTDKKVSISFEKKYGSTSGTTTN